jgi:hypothetical protein
MAHIANSLDEGAMLWHERLGHLNMESLKRSHMDNQIDYGFTMHGKEESDGDLMRQSRCNIIDQKSHSPCTNKTH